MMSTLADPLTSPLCFRCGFSGANPFPSDRMWSVNGDTLTNGSMNGSVLINPSNNNLILLNPGSVLSVNGSLKCSSTSIARENTVFITEFSKLIVHLSPSNVHTLTIVFKDPTLSPDGGSDMTVDVTEGTHLTLSCRDPGNTGITTYRWFDSTGSPLTTLSATPPLSLTLNNIQRESSGLYICRSTKNNVPGVIKMSNVTINVQCKSILSILLVNIILFLDPAAINSISPASATLPRGNMVTINCTFEGNPTPENITWERNGTVLDTDNFAHISVNTQTIYTELILTVQEIEDSGSYVCVTENIIGIERSSKVNITVQG